MRFTQRPVAAGLMLAALLTTAGCFWDQGTAGEGTEPPSSKQEPAAGPAVGQPEAAQKPRPGSEPLFHATSSTGGEAHEFEMTGGFTVRFACKGGGTATVSLNATTRYEFACTPQAPEQLRELTVVDANPRTYRVQVSTTSAKNTWSLFLDRLHTRQGP